MSHPHLGVTINYPLETAKRQLAAKRHFALFFPYTGHFFFITKGAQRVTNTPSFTGCPTIT